MSGEEQGCERIERTGARPGAARRVRRGRRRRGPRAGRTVHDGLQPPHRPPLRPHRCRRPRLRARHQPARLLPVHPRRPQDRLPRQVLDHPHVQRLRLRRGDEPALPRPPRRREQRALHRLRHAHAHGLRPRRALGRGRVRLLRSRRRLPRRHGHPSRWPAPRQHHDVHDHQQSRACHLGPLHRRCREARRSPRQAGRHPPERHSQGVHRPERVHLPAPRVDAPRHGYGRVRRRGDAPLEPRLRQRLPHPRSRLDLRSGARLHPRRWHRVREVGARPRPRRR